MDRATVDSCTGDLEKHLQRCAELMVQQHTLEGRLQRVESEKDTVKEDIYEKVRDEYQRELDNLLEQIEPIEKEINDARATVSEEFDAINARLDGLRDQLDELTFRVRVGEFDKKEAVKKESPLKQELNTLSKRNDELAGILRRIAAISGPDGEAIQRAGAVDRLSDFADPSEEVPAPTDEADAGVSVFPALIITHGPGAGKKLPLVPMTMTLGREHDNNIELKDEDVSRYHARIMYRDGAYLLEDLEGSSGTWVNGELTTEARLKHGDKVRIGNTEMMIDFE